MFNCQWTCGVSLMKQTITIIITLHLSGVSEYKGEGTDPPAQFAAKHGARASQHGNLTQRHRGASWILNDDWFQLGVLIIANILTEGRASALFIPRMGSKISNENLVSCVIMLNCSYMTECSRVKLWSWAMTWRASLTPSWPRLPRGWTSLTVSRT